MKKWIACALVLVVMFGLVACGGRTGTDFDKPEDLYTFDAKILEIHDSYFLVEPSADSHEANSSDKIQVSTQNADPSAQWQVGDSVRITYNGQIQELYPAIVPQVYKVEKLPLASTEEVGYTSTTLKPGYYYLVGEYEEWTTPYVNINFDDDSFAFGEGAIISYAEHGSFKIKGEMITASTQNTTFVFQIKDASTIILIDCGNYEAFAKYEGSAFVYHSEN